MNRKKLTIGLIVLVIIGIGLAIYKSKHEADKPKEAQFETVETRDIDESVTASGNIYAEDEVKISSDVSGEIVELYVKEGQVVQKGELLTKIQPETYQALLEQAQAQYNNATANLKNAQANYHNLLAKSKQVQAQLTNAEQIYQRAKKLYASQSTSQADLEQATANYQSAKAEVDAANESIKGAQYSIEGAQASVKGALASIKDAQSNLSKTSIFAPMSGIISLLNVEQGEKVVGTLQMAGTEMMRISNFNHMEVRVDVSENEIIKVKNGDTADIEVDAYYGRKFKGIVTQVSNSSKGLADASLSTEQSSNFVVRIRILENSYTDLLNKQQKPFLPGMSATVDIYTNHAKNAISVPVQAVVTREDTVNHTTDEVIFKVKNGQAKQQKVETGIQDESYIQITSGIQKGDKIIIGPYDLISKTLKDGDPVVEEKEK